MVSVEQSGTALNERKVLVTIPESEKAKSVANLDSNGTLKKTRLFGSL